MKYRIAGFLLALCLVLLPGALLAQSQQSPFTLEELNRFLADFPQFLAHMEEQGHMVENTANPDAWKAAEMRDIYTDYVQSKGWSVERFSYVASHVSQGLVAAEVRTRTPEIESQLAEARESIMSNPSMSQAMKQQMLAQLEQSMAQTRELEKTGEDIPQSEMALIQSNKDRIRKVFEEE